MIKIVAEFPHGVFHGTDYQSVDYHIAPPLAALLETAACGALEEELSNIEVRLVLVERLQNIAEHKLFIDVQIDRSSLHHSLYDCAKQFRAEIDDLLDEFGFERGDNPCEFPDKYRIRLSVIEAAVSDG